MPEIIVNLDQQANKIVEDEAKKNSLNKKEAILKIIKEHKKK